MSFSEDDIETFRRHFVTTVEFMAQIATPPTDYGVTPEQVQEAARWVCEKTGLPPDPAKGDPVASRRLARLMRAAGY